MRFANYSHDGSDCNEEMKARPGPYLRSVAKPRARYICTGSFSLSLVGGNQIQQTIHDGRFRTAWLQT